MISKRHFNCACYLFSLHADCSFFFVKWRRIFQWMPIQVEVFLKDGKWLTKWLYVPLSDYVFLPHKFAILYFLIRLLLSYLEMICYWEEDLSIHCRICSCWRDKHLGETPWIVNIIWAQLWTSLNPKGLSPIGRSSIMLY